MAKQSAGILLYRNRKDGVQVFLAHSGGPYYAKKDDGHWSIPKGILDEGETLLEAAYREFAEEIGCALTRNTEIPLTSIHRSDGKIIHAWAVEDTQDIAYVSSNTTEIEWPPRSGVCIEIPEVDRAEWFTLADARVKLHRAQLPFLEELEARLQEG